MDEDKAALLDKMRKAQQKLRDGMIQVEEALLDLREMGSSVDGLADRVNAVLEHAVEIHTKWVDVRKFVHQHTGYEYPPR